MDPTSFWFLLFIVLAGGTVAWYGDILGRKLGKSRRTIHKKIRPKKFAAAMTFIFGCAGTALTIAVLFGVSAPVRNWILEGNAARDRLAKTRVQLDNAEIKLTEANSRLATVEPKLQELGDEVSKKTDELKTVKTQQQLLAEKNTNLGTKARELSSRIGNLTSQFKTVNTRLSKVQSERAQLDSQVKNAQGQLNTARNEQNRITGDNAQIQEENFRLTSEALQLEKGLRTLQKELESVANEYDQLRSASRKADERFNEQLSKFQSDLQNAERTLRETRNTLAQEKAALEQFRADQGTFDAKALISRNSTMMFAKRQEVHRITVPAGLNLAEAKDAVSRLVRDTKLRAEAAGAEKTVEGNYAGLPTDYSTGKPLTEQQQLDGLTRALIGQARPKVIIANALLNTFDKEFVPIKLDVFDNVLAYEAGALILTINIDGRKSYAEITNDINRALETELPSALIAKDVIPSIGSPNPFGELSIDRIFDIIIEVKEFGRPARLQLFAAKDIYSADKISVNFRLRP